MCIVDGVPILGRQDSFETWEKQIHDNDSWARTFVLFQLANCLTHSQYWNASFVPRAKIPWDHFGGKKFSHMVRSRLNSLTLNWGWVMNWHTILAIFGVNGAQETSQCDNRKPNVHNGDGKFTVARTPKSTFLSRRNKLSHKTANLRKHFTKCKKMSVRYCSRSSIFEAAHTSGV